MTRFHPGHLAAALAGLLLSGVAFGQSSVDETLKQEFERQTGTCITIIFDNSGSMKGPKIVQAKNAFRSWLSKAPDDYRYSLVTFVKGGKLEFPLGEDTKAKAAEKVAAMEAKYRTPICGSLAIAHAQIRERRAKTTPYERHVVLLFTDGAENTDPRKNRGVQEDVWKLRNDIVEVVGIGFHGEGDYLDGVATRFFAAGDEAELERGLSQVDAEIGDISEIEVSDADLEEIAQMTFVAPPAPGAAPPPLDLESFPAERRADGADPTQAATPPAPAPRTATSTTPQARSGGGAGKVIVVAVVIAIALLGLVSRALKRGS